MNSFDMRQGPNCSGSAEARQSSNKRVRSRDHAVRLTAAPLLNLPSCETSGAHRRVNLRSMCNRAAWFVGFRCVHRSHPPACECSCTTYRVWNLSSVPWRVEEEQLGQPANKRVAFRKCFCCCFFVPAIDKQEETFRPAAESHNSRKKK